MNKYYDTFKLKKTQRGPAFDWVFNNILDKEKSPQILEIGSIRPNEEYPDFGCNSDGFSSFYWAEYLQKRKTGNLTIVDTNQQSINIAKEILQPFADVDIKFICDNGFNWVANPEFNFIYLDGPDDINMTFQFFNKINRNNTTILCDDANFHSWEWGKCLLLRVLCPNYIIFRLPETNHEMMMYPKLDKEINWPGFYIVDLRNSKLS